MKHPFLFPASLAVLLTSGFHALAAPEDRAESPGPLLRHDPNATAPEFLVNVHGDPRKGLPEKAGYRVQKVSDKVWYLETGRRIARMEPDYTTGQVIFRGIIEAHSEWAVSPDGKQIFACRKPEQGDEVSECFDIATGESRWTFEKNKNVMDVCFSPDGKQVAILHTLPRSPGAVVPTLSDDPTQEEFERYRKAHSPGLAAVSWYDAATGEMKRRVNVPGSGYVRGLYTDHIAYSGSALIVARPCDDVPGECMIIKPGATETEKVDVSRLGSEETPQLCVGGKHGEFVVFHNDYVAVLFQRKKDGNLDKLNEVRLERTPDGNSYDWCARFTPDGKHLVMSSCLRSVFIPTLPGASGKEFAGSAPLADFSTDGRFFVTFDDGGGRVRNVANWQMVESIQTKMRPPHCCPITEAGFSFFGDYIVSCDNVRLLLWSKDGVQLAELYSPRSDDRQPVKMQSPVIVEKESKIYGADGYDFLVWDLKALLSRLSRKPDNVPRVKGEVVFNDRERRISRPELMNIRLDAKGENIITATQRVVRYRPLAASPPVIVPVPKDDIYMRPRMFMEGTTPGTIIVRPGMDAYTLDLTGQKNAELLGQHVIGTNNAASQVFSSSGQSIFVFPMGDFREVIKLSSPLAILPSEWYMRPEFAVVSPDSKWVIAIPTVWGKGSVLAVVDVAKREIVRSLPLSWTATSLSLSNDGKRLLVGSTNRAVYEFDVEKMTAEP